MLWLDEKYARLLGPTLERFTPKGGHRFNFRCPLCGDSARSKTKTRGYIYPNGDKLFYKCHNCNIALPFAALLKRQSVLLYNEYLLEKLQDSVHTSVPDPTPQPILRTIVPKMGEVPVYDVASQSDPLAPLHNVYRFLKGRQLPDSAFTRLYATQQAKSWLLPLMGPKAEELHDGIPFLIQPFRLADGSWYGAQIRRIDKKEFYTYRWSHDPLKLFGLDAFDPIEPTWIVEGPIDSLFIPNALAPCGADMLQAIRIAEDQNVVRPTTRRVFVWDNEPRNSDVRRHMRHAISLQEHVVIWPKEYPKDINDMVKAGIDVMSTMTDRTFHGVRAELEFSAWQK